MKNLPRINNSFRLSYAFSKFYEEVWQNKTGNYDYDNRNKMRRRDSPMVVVAPELIKQEIYNKFSPVF
jgi:hypothetical protein